MKDILQDVVGEVFIKCQSSLLPEVNGPDYITPVVAAMDVSSSPPPSTSNTRFEICKICQTLCEEEPKSAIEMSIECSTCMIWFHWPCCKING